MKYVSYVAQIVAIAALGGGAELAGLPVAQAGTIYTYVTPTGSTDPSGEPVSAKAVITLDTNTVTIDLTNTLAPSIKSMGQVLTGITVTYAGNLIPTSIASSSGALIDVDKSGTVTAVGTNPQSISSVNNSEGWNIDSTGFLSVFGTGGPDYGLLDYQTSYPQSNGSILGNPPHNPFTNTTDSFVLNAPGTMSTTTIKSVVFQFGTTQGQDTQTGTLIPPSGGTPVPEPTSVALFSIALAGLGCRYLRRKSSL